LHLWRKNTEFLQYRQANVQIPRNEPHIQIESIYLFVVQSDLFRGFFAQFDTIGAIDFTCDYTDFLLNRTIQIVQVAEALLVRIACVDNGVGKLESALSALTPVEGRDGCICTSFESSNSNSFQLSIRIGPKKSV
jgi:hypothetical protein